MAAPKSNSAPSMDIVEQQLELEGGRSLAVVSEGPSQVVEIRASSGQVELRIKVTEDGPVLQLDGVKLSVNAVDSIDMQCKTFSVAADESVAIASKGTMNVSSEDEMTVNSTADLRLRGRIIYLN